MTQGGWLRIEGTLTRNGWYYAPKPGHEAARIPSEFLTQLGAQEANDIEALLLGPGDALMARGKPRLQRSVCGGRQGASPLRVAAYLPLLPGAAAYEVRNAGVVLHRAAIPEAAPAVRIAHCTLDGDTVHVEWQAERAGAGSLHSWVACVLGGRTFPLE